MLTRFVLLAGFCTVMAMADAQPIKTPAPSPTQTIKQDFAISSIELTYSRPSMRGRKIFGDLEPWGRMWRTGANGATRIKFADSVTIGGRGVKAGEYVIYTVPQQNGPWEVIINKGINNWGIDGYKQTEDVARFAVTPVKLDKPVETFTMQFANIKSNTADLQMMWENTQLNIPITTDVESAVMAQINNAMNKDNRPYFQSAMFYLENGKDLNQAVAWFDKAIEQRPEAFWVYHQKANALAKLGKKEEARATAQKSMDIARQAKNDDYVRLNEKLIASLK